MTHSSLPPFPQLRVKTECSFRSAYGSVELVAQRIQELGVEVAAIVDSGGTWGHVRWEKALASKGIKAAFGSEFKVDQPEDEFGLSMSKLTTWALAEDSRAFYRFSSNQNRRWEEAPGVIRFSGYALTNPDQFDYIDINPASFGETRRAIELHKATGKPLVLTGANEYPTEKEKAAFLAWVDNKRSTPQHIITDKAEFRRAMRFLDDETFEKAWRGAFEVAERLPKFELPKAPIISVEGDLAALVREGKDCRIRMGHIEKWTEEYEARLTREMEMIRSKEFESYFIVVADLVVWAKQHMLVGPARGSSAGSLVCYLLRITEVDPLPHGLLFERFIDINRNDLPDIDIDFNDQKREMCFTYLAEKYGQENVARIGSINTLKPRSVMAHVGKKMGIPHGATFPVLNVLIEYSSGDSRYGKGLEDTLNNTQPGRSFMERYPEAAIMGELENHASHTGVHAAGIIVSNQPVVEFCTVKDGIAQVDKKDAEHLNLLKIDALGLRTLGVIEDAHCITAEQLYALKMDDPEVFAIFNERRFSGVFQFEGAAQRRVSVQVPIVAFRQIDHVTALARPGPLGGGAAGHYINRNAGREPVTYQHPSMEQYLGETMGVVLYQEQVMRIVRELGKFSWEETSTIRKAMSGRKGKEFFDRRGEIFREGAASVGIDSEKADEIWNEICSFGAWGMNKCISGKTRVKLCHPNQALGSDPTIEDLYKFYEESPSPWIKYKRTMPVLLCLGEDGVARPKMAVGIHFNGKLQVQRYTLSDGEEIVCTRLHKFIINGEWKAIKHARAGDEIHKVERVARIKNHSFIRGKGWRKGRTGGAGDAINSRTTMKKEFILEKSGCPCERCGQHKSRMEVHHNDHCGGKERPKDLAWLCSGCHKKVHVDFGDWLPPYARGWKKSSEPVYLVKVEELGLQDTYDIEMPEPDHNYVLANGIVTHNSHTTSYAIISYWCAYMKRYHSIEYAAACLRSAKDDDQVIEILRELRTEGIDYIPFDPILSEENWSAKDGKLIGGMRSLVGIGPVKAANYINKRNTTGLTQKDLDYLGSLKIKNKELYPAHALWGDLYRDPSLMNVAGRIGQFSELEDGENAVVICKIVRKERRDENETVRAASRGYLKEGQTLFLDLFVVDDSVSKPVLARVRPEMWEDIGIFLADRGVDGVDWLLIRGRWLLQFSMMIIKKVKCLTNPDIFEVEYDDAEA